MKLDVITLLIIVSILAFIGGLYAGDFICNTGGWVTGH